ncbi:MAG TPA: VOC family protein [Acidimicrobiales bacterium]|nr:VOC family protein [Acidimicrobiales bacterium]
MADGFEVQGFDHLVLRCTDVETTLAWYRDALGLETIHVEEWRQGDRPFPSVRVSATTIIDLLPGDPSGERLNHICIVVAPCDLVATAEAKGLRVWEGPVPRFGAQGDGTSIYVLDPDDLTVELRHYGNS